MGILDSLASGFSGVVSTVTSGVSNIASSVGNLFNPNNPTAGSTMPASGNARSNNAVNSAVTGKSSPATPSPITTTRRSNSAVNSKYTSDDSTTDNRAESEAAKALTQAISGSVENVATPTATEADPYDPFAFAPMTKQESMAQAVAVSATSGGGDSQKVAISPTSGGGDPHVADIVSKSNISNTAPDSNIAGTGTQSNITQPTIVYVPTETETTETETDSGLMDVLKAMFLQNLITQSTSGGNSSAGGVLVVEPEPETTETTETAQTDISALIKQNAVPLAVGAGVLVLAAVALGGKRRR